MRSTKFIAVLVAAMLIMAVIAPVAAGPSEAQATGVTVEAFQAVNVRSGPATMYTVVGQLSAGDIVNATGRSDSSNDWLRVDLNGTEGWVAFFAVTVHGDPNTLPVATATAPVAIVLPSVQAITDLYVTAFRRVNVRSGPTTRDTILGVLTPGSTADITGRSDANNNWLQINFNGKPGWVAFFAVNTHGDPNEAPIVETAGVETFNAPTGTGAHVFTRFSANLRATPSLDGDVLATIPFDTELVATARTADTSWLKVTFNGQTGWVIASLVNVGSASDISALPVATS
jgi:uncharacterized protein YraI